MTLHLENIHHCFGNTRILHQIDLNIHPGEVVCLLGPSGCGKTTLLRIIAGLEKLQKGRIHINGRIIAGPEKETPPEKRGIGFLFQDFALFPHLTVLENTAFGLSGIKDRHRKKTMAVEALVRVGMQDFFEAHPHQLSGGQQQRVALARALAPGPEIILLDEPFSSLDTRLRNQIRDQTLHILKTSGVATILVTHDPEEAMFMADRIILMNQGRIVQQGDPQTLYFYPADAFAAAFFSEVNTLEGTVTQGVVKTVFGPVPAPGLPEQADVQVMFRPDAVSLVFAPAPEKNGVVPAEIETTRMLLGATLVHLKITPVDPGLAPAHVHARIPGLMPATQARLAGAALSLDQTFVFGSDHRS
jgi:iron(III) transport system ATP-binding protein